MKAPAPLLALLALAACATTPPPSAPPEPSGPPLTWARLGETISIDGPRVTPVAVLEDSRCPAEVQCVWAGRVRISAKVHLGSGTTTRELVTGQPISVADGSLELVAVDPEKRSTDALAPDRYRFGLRFMGGL